MRRLPGHLYTNLRPYHSHLPTFRAHNKLQLADVSNGSTTLLREKEGRNVTVLAISHDV